MKYWPFDCVTSCVSVEGKGPREGAGLGFGLSSSHHGLLLHDSLTGSQAPLSTHLLPPFYHQVLALAGNPMQLHHTAPEPAQFKARFSVKPLPDSQFSLLPLLSLEARRSRTLALFTVFPAAPLAPGTPPASLSSQLPSS